jgi:hypothetical protein
METPEDAKIFLDPESLILPSPLEEFPDLAASVELLELAIIYLASLDYNRTLFDYDFVIYFLFQIRP